VPIGTERLRLIIDAQDRASTALKSVDRSVSGLRQGINALIGLAGIGGGLAGLGVALRKALDVGEAGAQLANLERSFTRFAESTGANADQVLANMQRMSGGMMAQSELMEQYNRSFLLMGQDMAAQMPRLMQIAAAASAAGMGDFNFMLNSLVTGLGRLSPLILDNLGFTIKASEAYERYAQSIGKSADELSKAEQQMALLNVVTEQAENRFGDLDEAAQQMAGAGIAQLRAAIKDYTDMLQTEAYPAIDEYSGRMAQFVREATPGTEEYVNRVIAAIESLSSGIGRSVESYQASMAGLNSVNEQAMALVQTLDLAAMTTEQYTQLMRVLAEVAPDVAAALARQEEELAQQTLATLELQRAQAREIEQGKALARQMGTQNEVLARLAVAA